MGRLTETTNYDDLEKVYSIWICNENIPEEERNTISSYHIVKEDILGTVKEEEPIYDLMTSIIIRRGKREDEEGILDYLDGVFSSDIRKIKKYSNVEWSEKAEQMQGLGNAIYRQGKVSALLTVLSIKGEIPERLEQKIQAQTKNDLLDLWLKIAASAPDIDTFEEQIMGC